MLGDIGANIRSGFGKGFTSEFLQFRPLDHWVNQSPSHESNLNPLLGNNKPTQVGHLGWPSISVNPSAAINIPTKPW